MKDILHRSFWLYNIVALYLGRLIIHTRILKGLQGCFSTPKHPVVYGLVVYNDKTKCWLMCLETKPSRDNTSNFFYNHTT